MKTRLICLMTLLVTGFFFISCDSDEKEKWPEAKLVKELPKMYLEVMPTEETLVIKDRETFAKVFSESDISRYEDLTDIDWNTQTLLIGHGFYPNQANLIHEFKKVAESSYCYRVKVSGMATFPDNFVYGIVINKLPEDAEIIFKYEDKNKVIGIVKELPKMYRVEGIEVEENRIINDYENLTKIFKTEEITNYKEYFEEIDWSVHTLLIGRYFYVNQTYIEHFFEQTDENMYCYEVKIEKTGSTAIDDFVYGIIVDKLPSAAKVIFKLDERPEF